MPGVYSHLTTRFREPQLLGSLILVSSSPRHSLVQVSSRLRGILKAFCRQSQILMWPFLRPRFSSSGPLLPHVFVEVLSF